MSQTTVQMYQCYLRSVESPATYTTGWIEARAAKQGARIEMLPSHTLWDVVQVFDSAAVDSATLRETQQQRRQGLPSLQGKQR